MGLSETEKQQLANLRFAFEHNGGRGVELADEIDALEAKRSSLTSRDFQDIINEVKCPPFHFRLGCVICVREDGKDEIDDDVHPGTDHVLFLQAKMWRTDVVQGKEGWGYGGKYLLSPHMTDGEIIKKCFVACRDFAEHEVREAFEWRGRRILGPHLSVHSLWDVAKDLEERM